MPRANYFAQMVHMSFTKGFAIMGAPVLYRMEFVVGKCETNPFAMQYQELKRFL